MTRSARFSLAACGAVLLIGVPALAYGACSSSTSLLSKSDSPEQDTVGYICGPDMDVTGSITPRLNRSREAHEVGAKTGIPEKDTVGFEVIGPD